MTITISKTKEDEYVILLGDSFDFNCIEEFRRTYESKGDGAHKDFVIDFRRTIYMDSSGLGMLINMKKYWQDHSGEIRIINSSPLIKKIFLISRFDKKFIIE